jgi:hypothetical protein
LEEVMGDPCSHINALGYHKTGIIFYPINDAFSQFLTHKGQLVWHPLFSEEDHWLLTHVSYTPLKNHLK